jgi:hypothetical protein
MTSRSVTGVQWHTYIGRSLSLVGTGVRERPALSRTEVSLP